MFTRQNPGWKLINVLHAAYIRLGGSVAILNVRELGDAAAEKELLPLPVRRWSRTQVAERALPASRMRTRPTGVIDA